MSLTSSTTTDVNFQHKLITCSVAPPITKPSTSVSKKKKKKKMANHVSNKRKSKAENDPQKSKLKAEKCTKKYLSQGD